MSEPTINRPWDMQCNGCKSDLSVSRKLELSIQYGRLTVECPSCGYLSLVMIDNQGLASFVEMAEATIKDQE